MPNKASLIALDYAHGVADGTELIEAFDRLVMKIVTSRWGWNEDLFQEGRIAVLINAEEYDHHKGEYSTFVFHKITTAVNSAAPHYIQTGAIVPAGTLKKYRSIMRHANDDPEIALSICGEHGMSASTFVEVAAAVTPSVFDADLEAIEAPYAEAELNERVVIEWLEEQLGGDATLYMMFHGITDGQRRSARELARLQSCTEADIRVRIRRCTRRLKAAVRQAE